MKRIVLIIGILGSLVFLIVGWFVSNMMKKPFYLPGMVSQSTQLDGPLQPPVGKASPSFWQVTKNVRLYHFEEGEGEPVLWIHGGPGIPQHQPIQALEAVKNKHRVYYYHQRGCGRSTRPVDKLSKKGVLQNIRWLNRQLGVGTQVADIERIRRLLKVESLVLIGHSFGGFLATLYAAEFPKRVKGLVLLAPSATLVAPVSEDANLFEVVKKHLSVPQKHAYESYLERSFDFQGMLKKREEDLRRLNEEFVHFYRLAAQNRFMVPTSPRSMDMGGWMITGMYLSMGREHDYRDALKKVLSPTLILHGEKDLQPEFVAKEYAKLLPNSRYKEISNAGHFMFLDRPKEVADHLHGFLKHLKK